MGFHIEKSRQEYWKASTHNLGRYMTKTRWEQIYRFLTVNPQDLRAGEPFWHKIEPFATSVRESCRQASIPSSHVAVDEVMIAFIGRSVYPLCSCMSHTFGLAWFSRIGTNRPRHIKIFSITTTRCIFLVFAPFSFQLALN